MRDNTLSVLLVDDDPYVCDICQLIFQHHQLPLTTVNNAVTALEYLSTHGADVIILDLFLPDMDGYRVLDAIRRMPHGPQTKVVATTAYYTNDTGQEIIERGFDGYLPKPLQADTLIRYLQSIAAQD
mgnify:CR=1 FL=1